MLSPQRTGLLAAVFALMLLAQAAFGAAEPITVRIMDLAERPVTRAEAGRSPRECEDLVVAVVRGRRVLKFTDPEVAVLQLTDRIITVRRGVSSG